MSTSDSFTRPPATEHPDRAVSIGQDDRVDDTLLEATLLEETPCT